MQVGKSDVEVESELSVNITQRSYTLLVSLEIYSKKRKKFGTSVILEKMTQ